MKNPKVRKMKEARSAIAFAAIFLHKGRSMRHRANRRAKERESSWKKEDC